MPIHPLITRDPVSGGELVITRMECLESEVVIEGKFSLGWISRLSYEQLEFVRLLVQNRGNIQRLAAEMNVASTTLWPHWRKRMRLPDPPTPVGLPTLVGSPF